MATSGRISAGLALMLSLGVAHAGEREHAERFCERVGGQTEYQLREAFGPPTRVDCLTPTHAWEVDWAPKWAEGIGQARYYSVRTGKRAGVVLLMRDEGDYRYVRRLLQGIGGLPIDIRLMEVEEH